MGTFHQKKNNKFLNLNCKILHNLLNGMKQNNVGLCTGPIPQKMHMTMSPGETK
jgi:hypothetical protein